MIKDQKVHIYGFLLLVLTLLPANAQWEKTSAIVGGVIVSIAMSDSIILAGTQQG